jgi:WD40 repeat protein
MKRWLAAILLLLTACSSAAPQGGLPEATPTAGAMAVAQAAGARQVLWLPGGQSLALAKEQSVALVQPAAPVPQAQDQPQPAPVQAQALSQAQSPALLAAAQTQPVLAWVSADTDVVVWNQASGQPQPAGQSGAPVTGLAVSPDGARLAYVTYDGTLVVQSAALLDAGAQAAPASFKAPTWLTNLSFSPDGKLIGGTDPAGFTVYILDAATGQTLRTLDWSASPTPALYGAFFSPDWQRIAWVSQGVVQVMDVATGRLGALLSHSDAVTAVAWSPDGMRLATASAAQAGGSPSPAVLVWDARTGDLLRTLPLASAAQSLSYSADGRLAVLDSSGNIQVFP